jgi:mono/diheme cytochrome c family protein
MFTLRHRALRPLRAACAAIALFGLTAFGDAEKDARPNPESLAIAALQSALSGKTESPRVLRIASALAAGREPPPADGLLAPLEAQGRKVFEASCTSCHGGPTMTVNSDARFLPIPSRGPKAEGGQDFVAIFAGTPRPPPPGLPPPKVTPLFFDGLPTAGLENKPFAVTLPTGAVTNLLSSDPGRGLVTGDLREFGRFDVPTLFGIALTAPYFHDNSARDLDAVIEHYQALFRFLEFLDIEGGFFAPKANGQGCEPGTCGFRPIPDADVPALKAYLEQLGR